MKLVRKFRESRRYPVWNVTSVIVVTLLVLGITACLVFALGHRTLPQELQLTLAIIGGCLYLFLAVGLYRGIRFRKERVEITFDMLKTPDWAKEGASAVDVPADFAAGADDLTGCLISIAIWVALVLAVFILIWIVLPMLWAIAVLLVFGLYWVFYLALRRTFMMSRRCRGRLGPSLGWALHYTALYTGWIFALLLATKYIVTAQST